MEGFLVRDTTDRGELQVAKKAERTRDKKILCKLRAKPQASIGIGKAKVIIRPRGKLAKRATVQKHPMCAASLELCGSRDEGHLGPVLRMEISLP